MKKTYFTIIGILLLILNQEIIAQGQNFVPFTKACPKIPLELFTDRQGDLNALCLQEDSMFAFRFDSTSAAWQKTHGVRFINKSFKASTYPRFGSIKPFYLNSKLFVAINGELTNEVSISEISTTGLLDLLITGNNSNISDVMVKDGVAYLSGNFFNTGRFAGATLVSFEGQFLDSLANTPYVIKKMSLSNDSLLLLNDYLIDLYNIPSRKFSRVFTSDSTQIIMDIVKENDSIFLSASNLNVYKLSGGNYTDTIYTKVQYGLKGKNVYGHQVTYFDGKVYRAEHFANAREISLPYQFASSQAKEMRSFKVPDFVYLSDTLAAGSGFFKYKNKLLLLPRQPIYFATDTNNLAFIEQDSLLFFENDTLRLQAFLDLDSNGVFGSAKDQNIIGAFLIGNNNPYSLAFDVPVFQTISVPNYKEWNVDALTTNNCAKLSWIGSLICNITPPNTTKDTLLFPFKPLISKSQLEIKIVKSQRARLNDTIQNELIIADIGCEFSGSNVDVKIVLPANTLLIAANTAYNKMGDTLVIAFSNLQPNNPKKFIFDVVYTNTAFKLDEVAKTRAYIAFSASQNVIQDSAVLHTKMVYSYDPNEKISEPSGIITADFTKIQYTIHFENEGNGEARTVTVVDTIDTRLPALYYRMISASHPYSINIRNGRIVTWTFVNINLAAKGEDRKASQGYLAFEARINVPLAIGDSIRNRAGIYFDLNEPIITNHAVIMRMDFTDNLPAMEKAIEHVLVYPNPIVGALTLVNQETKEQRLILFDLQGKRIMEIVLAENSSTTIDLKALSLGVYVLQNAETGQSVKIMKQ